jgi:hypothetical protein
MEPSGGLGKPLTAALLTQLQRGQHAKNDSLNVNAETVLV